VCGSSVKEINDENTKKTGQPLKYFDETPLSGCRQTFFFCEWCSMKKTFFSLRRRRRRTPAL
jgi:hypothetical protein